MKLATGLIDETGALYGAVIQSSQHVPIAVVLSEQDKENISRMAPGATVYCEFVPLGEEENGATGYAIPAMEKWLERVKELGNLQDVPQA